MRATPSAFMTADHAAPGAPVQGTRYGSWILLNAKARRAWCQCDCGTMRWMALDALLAGESTSCGCAAPTQAEIERTRALKARVPDWRPQR